METVLRFCNENRIPFRKNEPLFRHSTFRIGGPADLAIFPSRSEQLAELIPLLDKEGIPRFVAGNGSNVLFADGGFRGTVLFTAGMDDLSRDGLSVTASCGVTLTALSRFACREGLSGAAFLFGIPGSVGGGVYMNAGAYGSEISSVLLSCSVLFADGSVCDMSNDACGFSYRYSILRETGGIVLSARIGLAEGNRADIEREMRELLARRSEKQPLEWPSAGSVFKRPARGFAAQMIDECGLKGTRVGGAVVSEKHAGFIVNTGGASAKDVRKLMEIVSRTVWEKKGVLLEPEIILMDEGEERGGSEEWKY